MPVLGRSYPATPNFVIQRRVVVQPPIVVALANQAFIIRSAYSPLISKQAVFSPPFTATTTTVSGTADLSQTRTNLSTNPSGETNTTGWSYLAQSSGAAASLYQSGVNPLYGNFVLRFEITTAATSAANNGAQTVVSGISPGDTITASVWVRPSVAQTFKLGMDWNGTASLSATSVAVSCPAGVWTQITASGTAPASTTGITLNAWTNTGVAWALGNLFDIDGLLVERSSTVGSYFDTTTSIITNTATAAVSGGPIPPPGPPNRSWLYPPLIRRSATTTVPVPAASTSSSGTTSLTVTPTVLSAATVTVSGSSTLTVTPAVTSAANATVSGSTSLTVIPSVLSAGSITVVGATVLTVTPSVLSAGSAATSGATTLTVTPPVTANGVVVYAVPIASPPNRSWMYLPFIRPSSTTVTSVPAPVASVTVTGVTDLLLSGRTNLQPNPSGEIDATGWTWTATDPTGTVSSFADTTAKYGSQVIRLSITSNQVAATTVGITAPAITGITAGEAITASVWVRPSRTQTQRIRITWSGGGTFQGALVSCPAGVWTQLSTTGTAPSGTTGLSVGIHYTTGSSLYLSGDTYDFDGLLVERSRSVGSYLDTSTTTVSVLAAGSLAGSNDTSLVVTPSVTSTGSITFAGDTSLIVSPATTTAGTITVTGTTSLTVTPLVPSVGSTLGSGTTSLVVTPSVTSAGSITVSSTSSLVVTPSVTSVGSTLGSGTTSLVVTPSVTSVGSILGSGTTSLVVTPTVTSVGSSTVSGTSSLVVSPSVTSAGSVTVVGSTSLAVTPSVSSVGSSTLTVSGSSTTVLTPSVSATGTITITGTATTIITPTTGAGYSLTVRASAILIITPATSAANVPPTSASTSLSVAITITSNGQLITALTKYVFTGSRAFLQDRVQERGFLKAGAVHQYSVIKKGSVYTESSYPTSADYATADIVYRGGFTYEVTSDEAARLQAAGYAITQQHS